MRIGGCTGVSPPTGTPATEVPGAMRTRDAAAEAEGDRGDAGCRSTARGGASSARARSAPTRTSPAGSSAVVGRAGTPGRRRRRTSSASGLVARSVMLIAPRRRMRHSMLGDRMFRRCNGRITTAVRRSRRRAELLESPTASWNSATMPPVRRASSGLASTAALDDLGDPLEHRLQRVAASAATSSLVTCGMPRPRVARRLRHRFDDRGGVVRRRAARTSSAASSTVSWMSCTGVRHRLAVVAGGVRSAPYRRTFARATGSPVHAVSPNRATTGRDATVTAIRRASWRPAETPRRACERTRWHSAM